MLLNHWPQRSASMKLANATSMSPNHVSHLALILRLHWRQFDKQYQSTIYIWKLIYHKWTRKKFCYQDFHLSTITSGLQCVYVVWLSNAVMQRVFTENWIDLLLGNFKAVVFIHFLHWKQLTEKNFWLMRMMGAWCRFVLVTRKKLLLLEENKYSSCIYSTYLNMKMTGSLQSTNYSTYLIEIHSKFFPAEDLQAIRRH